MLTRGAETAQHPAAQLPSKPDRQWRRVVQKLEWTCCSESNKIYCCLSWSTGVGWGPFCVKPQAFKPFVLLGGLGGKELPQRDEQAHFRFPLDNLRTEA